MRIEASCKCGATFKARGLDAARRHETWQLMHPCTVRGHQYTWSVKPDPRATI